MKSFFCLVRHTHGDLGPVGHKGVDERTTRVFNVYSPLRLPLCSYSARVTRMQHVSATRDPPSRPLAQPLSPPGNKQAVPTESGKATFGSQHSITEHLPDHQHFID